MQTTKIRTKQASNGRENYNKLKNEAAKKIQSKFRSFAKNINKAGIAYQSKQLAYAANTRVDKGFHYTNVLHTPYLASLKHPESATQSRVSGMADKTVALKRHLSTVITTNVAGATCFYLQPWLATAASVSSFFSLPGSNTTFDGVSIAGTGEPQSRAFDQNLTAGVAAGYRPVSMSVTVTPQASVLNEQGTIHACMEKATWVTPLAAGSNGPLTTANFFLSALNQVSNKREANISALQGIRAIWVPNDPCLLDFASINGNVVTDGSQGPFNILKFTITGAVNAPFRIDIHQNFEVGPAPSSVLLGMESIDPYDDIPTLAWRQIIKNDANIIQVIPAAASLGRNC